MNLKNENDLYSLHLQKYSLLNKKAEKNRIKINVEKYIQYDEKLIAEVYYIIFKNKKIFNYNLVSTNINKTYIVIKSKIFMELQNEDDIDKFIIFSIDYCNNIYNYYEIINKIFYINNSLLNYLNEIPIKKYSFNKIENIKIVISINNIFNIMINDTNNYNDNNNNDNNNINHNNDTIIDIIKYETIDQVINSELLISSKKTFLKNIISYFL
jgi:hypothetical protein